MGKEICIAVFALAYFGLSAGESYAAPSPRRDETPAFRFSFSEAELNTPASARRLDVRLRREVRGFCQQSLGGSPVLQIGCRSALVSAVRAQLRLRAVR